jgi:hypothetical protein
MSLSKSFVSLVSLLVLVQAPVARASCESDYVARVQQLGGIVVGLNTQVGAGAAGAGVAITALKITNNFSPFGLIFSLAPVAGAEIGKVVERSRLKSAFFSYSLIVESNKVNTPLSEKPATKMLIEELTRKGYSADEVAITNVISAGNANNDFCRKGPGLYDQLKIKVYDHHAMVKYVLEHARLSKK